MNYNQLLLAAQKNSDKQFLLLKKNGQNGRMRGPDPAAVAAFKARKEREERERMLRAEQEKNHLLALRAMNSKSMKKAHMMKSRTKDNDFSKIVKTDKDICVNEQINEQSFKDTKERMKARIDLEQKLSGLSRREKERYLSKWEREQSSIIKLPTKNNKQQIIKETQKNDGSTKINKPKSAPSLSYEELLKIASEKSQVRISLEEEIRAEIEFNQAKVEKRISAITQKDRQREEQRYKSKTSLANKRSLSLYEMQSPLTQSESSIKEKHKLFSESKSTKNTDSKSLNFQTPTPTKASNKNIQTKQIKSANLDPIKNHLMNTNHKSNRNEPITNKRPVNVSKQMPNLSKSMISSHKTETQKSSQQNSIGKPKVIQSRPPSFSLEKSRPKLPPIGATYRRGIYDNYYYQNEPEDTYYDDEMDDYEDDMDDFIDDGPLEQDDEEEYSKHIREIFGYDKRKYRHMIEDDDDCEVATYGQVMREEMRSLREGIKEDLEDIQREEEEKRMKKKAKLSRLKR